MNCKSIKSPMISQKNLRLVLLSVLLAMVLSMVSTWSHATNHDLVAITVSCTNTADINTCTVSPDTSSIVNLARTAINLGVNCTSIAARDVTIGGVTRTYNQQCTLPNNQEKILCDNVKNTINPVNCIVPGQTTISCSFSGTRVDCDMESRSLSFINEQFANFKPTASQAKFAEVITNICTKRNVSPDLQRDCDLLLGGAVNNFSETGKALEQITPEGASAPVDSSQSSVKAQNNNLATRFGELRRGIRGLSTRGIHLRTSNPIYQTALYEKLRGQLYAYAAASADEVPARPNQGAQPGNQPEAVPLSSPEASPANDSTGPIAKDQEPKKEAVTPSSPAPAPASTTNKKSSDALGGRLGTFVNGTIQVGEKDRSDTELGFNFKGADLTGGIDYRFSELFYLGLAFGYSNNSTEMNAQRGSLDMNGFNLIFYGSYYPAPGFFIDTNLNIGGNDYAQDRRIRYTQRDPVVIDPITGLPETVTVNQSATADYFGSQTSLHIGAGYEWAVDAMTFSPYVQMQYARADVNGYRESISDLNAPGSGWGLRIDDQKFQSLLATLGGEFNYAISRSWGVIMPQLRLEFVNELNDDIHVVQGQFIGDPDKEKFRLPTDKPDSNYFNVGLGISAVLPSGHTTYFFYQTVLGYTDLTQHVFNLGYRWEF